MKLFAHDRWWVYEDHQVSHPRVQAVKSFCRPRKSVLSCRCISGPFCQGEAIIEADRRQRLIDAAYGVRRLAT